jgi:C-terminal processing protease CtpA/Prc
MKIMRHFSGQRAVYSFIFFLLTVVLLSGLSGCKDEENETIDLNKQVNKWIWETMNSYYYWNDHIPANVDNTLSPDVFFESLLYKYDPLTAPDGDRFSWIEKDWHTLVDYLNGVESSEIGFDYRLYLMSANNNSVIGQVAYVKKGTPAEAAGLKRGDWFYKVDGTMLTTSNYSDLLTVEDGSFELSLLTEVYNQQGDLIAFSEGTTLHIATLPSYAENPVYLDTIYSIGSSRIGYLVYHFFAPDEGDGSLSYDKALNQVFARFEQGHITDLVLDLRYNSGGWASSAVHLASMIVPGLSDTKLFSYYEFNDEWNEVYLKENGPDALKTFFTTYLKKDGSSIEPIHHVGDQINRVYILTGEYTASASEQVINGLKPYMDVYLIGETTYGKNVGSITLYEENNSKNTWGMQLIVAKYFNSNGESDFTAGFTPDYPVDDMGMPNVKPLGDISEALLQQAVSLISGQPVSTVQKRSQTNLLKLALPVSIRVERGLQLENRSLFYQ